MKHTFTIKQNDTLPTFQVTEMAYGDGTPVIFASGDAAVFNLRIANDRSADKKVDGGPVELEEGTSNCTYAWQIGDTDTVGKYVAEVEVTFASGGVATWPNDSHFIVHVTNDV